MGNIERINRTIKYRARGIYNTIPFKKVLGRTIVDLVALIFFWINPLPTYPSIAGDLSPLYIITGMAVNCPKH